MLKSSGVSLLSMITLRKALEMLFRRISAQVKNIFFKASRVFPLGLFKSLLFCDEEKYFMIADHVSSIK